MMNALTSILRQKIAAEGDLSIADYMAIALGHPEHGYYQKQDPFGARGDFITAPEISQIFGEMIGVWCGEVWRQMGGGALSLVELGPGRGTLMADLLRATKKFPDFHDSITIHMVETSPVLANAQYMRLRYEHPRIEWLDSVEQLPDNKLLVIANEFFDALPVKQFIATEDGVHERRIGWNEKENEFCFTLGSKGLQLAKSGHNIPIGTIMEQSPASRNVMRTLASHIAEHGGAALVIDYGYLGEAHHNTLQAVKSHMFHPVLKDPGDADITAHVDFTTLMDIASDNGGTVFGLANQGEFLTRMGADLRCEMLLRQATAEQKEPIASGLKRLVSPQEMGELFKVMAVVSDPRIEPPGFIS
jgi:NADH dehydrogenase [ubiquinone] 1 alpha subcomplex assembly factor 7